MAETADRMVSLPSPRSFVDSEAADTAATEGVIGGRAGSWPPPGPAEDEGYEPTIVRGRD
ncbi:hypothetical protein [Actinokineospora iranica]|uniref:Uncharacterized protein n=1 Tax=Actinokineospora iranica TaxID=1271860 RepID=A0A1G6XFX7_9PSEU|nr:hypothetical protein [Actinokineospora iranica]SDD76703.1 hypothetical protein SAMN05216174_11772 [Actinokineospora iranica]